MAAFRDLTGKRFGRLTVLRRGPNDNHGKAMWVCRCDCEKEVKVNGASLVRSLTQSCGCLHRERTSEACLTLEPVSGERFGRLTFIEEVPREVSNNRVFRCFRLRCDCGNERVVRVNNLIAGNTTSCGCFAKEQSVKAGVNRIIHGDARGSGRAPEYITWRGMITRCCNPESRDYKRYGGRGIKVYKRGHKYEKFLEDLLATIGRKPGPEYSIDRIDNDKGYSPSNWRWATRSEQARNRRKRKKTG